MIEPDVIGLELELERFDLSLENRRATENPVCTEAAEAMATAGFGLKAATITPEGADDVGSPNRLIREGDRREGDRPDRPADPRGQPGGGHPPSDLGRAGWRSGTPTAPRSRASAEDGDEVA